MRPNCIDVSAWQQDIDWQRVKAAGIKAVIIRAGFSRTEDNQFQNHYNGARAAGLAIGAYWYSYAYSVEQAEREARACLDVISGKDFQLPVYYDMEEDGQMELGGATMTAIACRFIDTIQSAGVRGGMYSSPSWFSDFIDYDLMKSKCSIWLAHWASRPARECDIWQYGEDGTVDGVTGDCDVDIIMNESVIDGDAPEPQPQPTPEPSDTVSVVTVQKWLNADYNAGLEIDGIYGRKTKSALVSALQEELNGETGAGLVIDGVFGAATRAAVVTLYVGMRGVLIKILQAALICNGLTEGGLDGIFGGGTEGAVRAFQYFSGIYIDGVAGKETFSALFGYKAGG